MGEEETNRNSKWNWNSKLPRVKDRVNSTVSKEEHNFNSFVGPMFLSWFKTHGKFSL